jgi:hypothetical protein
MNWLKTLWVKLVDKTSVSAIIVEAEEVDPPQIGTLFQSICIAAGVKNRDLMRHNIIQLFEEWYDGNPSEEDVRQSIPAFMEEKGGVINAKLAKILK